MDKVSWNDILSFLDELSKSSSVSLPKVKGYDAKCLLGVGSTSFVYCVAKKEKELVLKFPKNPRCQDVLYAEAHIMKKMSQNVTLSQHLHLAHYHGPVEAQEGKGKHSQESILLSPVADFSNPPLTREDVVKLAGALSDLHSVGFLHRDISPGNIGHYLAGESFFEPFLRDFGCSIELEPAKLTPPRYAGTIATASTRVLKELAHGSERPCIEPMDDLESLLKSVILKATRSQVSANPGSSLSAKASASLEFWEGRGFIGEDSLQSIFQSTRYCSIGDFVLCLPPRKTAYEKKSMSPERPLIGGHSSKMPSPPKDLPPTSFQSPYARKTRSRPLLGQHPQGIILFGEDDKEKEEEMEEKEGAEEEEE